MWNLMIYDSADGSLHLDSYLRNNLNTVELRFS